MTRGPRDEREGPAARRHRRRHGPSRPPGALRTLSRARLATRSPGPPANSTDDRGPRNEREVLPSGVAIRGRAESSSARTPGFYRRDAVAGTTLDPLFRPTGDPTDDRGLRDERDGAAAPRHRPRPGPSRPPGALRGSVRLEALSRAGLATRSSGSPAPGRRLGRVLGYRDERDGSAARRHRRPRLRGSSPAAARSPVLPGRDHSTRSVGPPATRQGSRIPGRTG